jgi:hypothetical protein
MSFYSEYRQKFWSEDDSPFLRPSGQTAQVHRVHLYRTHTYCTLRLTAGWPGWLWCSWIRRPATLPGRHPSPRLPNRPLSWAWWQVDQASWGAVESAYNSACPSPLPPLPASPSHGTGGRLARLVGVQLNSSVTRPAHHPLPLPTSHMALAASWRWPHWVRGDGC